jgi:hypothetical protein
VYTYTGTWQKAGYKRDAFARLAIELPPSYVDDLSKKPSVQKAYRDSFDKFSPFDAAESHREYVNFYAHLNQLADGHLMTVLDTLGPMRSDSRPPHRPQPEALSGAQRDGRVL